MSPRSKAIPAILTALLLVAGCAGVTPAPQPTRSLPPQATAPGAPRQTPTSPETAETPRESPSPRAVASLELSKQARTLIESGRLDQAIRILEQAVNLHPGSGQNYYYLAEAWRLKGNASQAAEYNTLAAIHLKNDTGWMERIALQKKRIDEMKYRSTGQ